MKVWIKSLAALSMIVALGACGQMRPANLQDGTAEQRNGPDESTWSDPEIDSENLADEAESLLSIETLDAALAKFTEALKLNPKNSRADVWAAVIRTELEFRGILARVKPLVESMPDGSHRYDRMVDASNERNDVSLRHFYLTGPADIATLDDFQEWVDRVDMRLGELRETLDRHKNEELRLLAPGQLFGDLLKSRTDSAGRKKCDGREWGPIKYQPSDCSSTNVEFLMNRADIEALSVGLAGYQATIALMNGWRISPEAIKDILAHENDESYDSFGAIVRNGAKLRSKNHASLLDTGLRDFALSARYIIDHQKQACPKGRESRMNRPGYVFSFGLCVNQKTVGDAYDRTLRLLDQMIARRPVTIWTSTFDKSKADSGSLDQEFDFDLQTFAARPFTDLSELGPTHLDRCNHEVINMTPVKAFVVRGQFDEFLRAVGYGTCDGMPAGGSQ